jgi:hypothetical protein
MFKELIECLPGIIAIAWPIWAFVIAIIFKLIFD